MLKRLAVLSCQELPHALYAERVLLGTALASVEGMVALRGLIPQVDWFFEEAHQRIYEAMATLPGPFDTHEAWIPWLTATLESKEALQSIDGTEYLRELLQHALPAQRMAHYARMLRAKAMLRATAQVMIQGLEDALAPAALNGEEMDRVGLLLDRMDKRIFDLAQGQGGLVERDSAGVAWRDTIRKMGEPPSSARGLPMGISALDRVLRPLEPGEVMVIAEAYGGGATELLVPLLRHAVMALHHKCLLVPAGHARSWWVGQLSEGMNPEPDGEEVPLWFIGKVPSTALEFQVQYRKAHLAHGLELVVVDDLGNRLPATGSEQGWDHRLWTTFMARELGVPVVVTCRIMSGKGCDTFDPWNLARMGEWRTLAEEADTVVVVEKVEENGRTSEYATGTSLRVRVLKQRRGMCGAVDVPSPRRGASARAD